MDPPAGEAQDDVKEIDNGEDCSEWMLTTFDTHERNTWRAGVRSACVQSWLNMFCSVKSLLISRVNIMFLVIGKHVYLLIYFKIIVQPRKTQLKIVDWDIKNEIKQNCLFQKSV